MGLLIKGATVIDPSSGLCGVRDVRVEYGLVAAVDTSLASKVGERVIDATGLTLTPGFVDIHVHLRDPGFTYKEDILTGCAAAAAGGVTAVACMPNTNPVIDSPEIIRYIIEKAREAKARVYPVGCITKGMKGEVLCDFGALKAAGAVAVSDDGRPVEKAGMMQKAMEHCQKLSLPVISHCEDFSIIDGGIIHKGEVSKALGVKGMDRSSEDSITAREIALAEATGTSVHIAHVSTKGAVDLIRDAKKRGVKVSCETAPHYLLFTHKELLSRDANFRMNPPLREEEDVKALLQGVADGTIDAIITDHAPHSEEEKADFLTSPNGVVGLETSFAAAYTALVATGIIALERLVALMSTSPARLLHLPEHGVWVGSMADLTLLDTTERWTVHREKLHGRGKNTLFDGKTLLGKVKMTLLGGTIVFDDREEQSNGI